MCKIICKSSLLYLKIKMSTVMFKYMNDRDGDPIQIVSEIVL